MNRPDRLTDDKPCAFREPPATEAHARLSPTGVDAAEVKRDDRQFRLSLFKSPFATYPKLRTYTLHDLIALFTQRPIVRAAKDGRAFSPALFLGPRKKENVLELALLVLDYDHNASMEKDLKPWHELGLFFIVYTTHSHKRRTEQNPDAEERFRVLLPLARPIPADRFPALWTWAAQEASGHVDASGKDKSHPYLLPAIARPEAPFCAEAYDGKLLDWSQLALPPDPRPEAEIGDATVYLAGARQVSPRYASAALEYEAARVRSARIGTRNNTLNKAAFVIGQLVGAGWLYESQVLAELEAAAVGVGLPREEARRTIRSGLEAGKRHPRPVQPRRLHDHS